MIQLRPVEEKDKVFIEFVYRSTRENELSYTNWSELQKQAFISMQLAAQHAEYKKMFHEAEFQVIEFNKKQAGRLYTWENEFEIRLIDITLVPAFRGRGIGTKLLKMLLDKASMANKIVSLHVEANNPALNLYKRLGFIFIKNNGHHLYMEWKTSSIKGK